MNRAGLDMIQADSLDQVKGQCVYPLVVEEYREAFQELVSDVFQGKSRTLEFKVIGLKGRPCWLYSKVVPMRNDSGEIVSALSITIDITDRKKAEAELMESEDKFRSLVETTSDWIWEVNENALYTYVSPKVKDILGYEPQEIIGKTPFDLMPREEAERVTPEFLSFVANLKPLSGIANINRHKDGKLVVLETSGVPFFDGDGKYCGYRGIDRDITSRKKAEEERERLISELKEALANVKQLSAMLPICAYCKKIRDDKGYWSQVESYISNHTDTIFSHGICPECEVKAMKEVEELKKESGL